MRDQVEEMHRRMAAKGGYSPEVASPVRPGLGAGVVSPAPSPPPTPGQGLPAFARCDAHAPPTAGLPPLNPSPLQVETSGSARAEGLNDTE